MAWKSKGGKWKWRGCLNASELEFVKRADKARDKIRVLQDKWDEEFGLEMKMTSNRALQRAKFKARSKAA